MRTRCLLLAAVWIFAVLLAGCDRQNPPKGEGKAGESGVAKVQEVQAKLLSLVRVVEQPGTVQAFEETPLYAKLAGFVKKFYKLIGEPVKKADLLADLSIPELVEESHQKEALVEQAKVEVDLAGKNLETAKASVLMAEAQVKVALAAKTRAQANYDRWQSESQRITKMAKGGFVEVQTRDETYNQFKAAEATRNETTEQIGATRAMATKSIAEKNRAEVDVKLAEARQKVAEAEARRLQELVKYTHVVAPFTGVVTKRNVDTGKFVQPADSGKAEPLYTVVKLDPVLVAIHVPETDAALVADRQEVRLAVQALSNREFLGKVARTSWALEPGSRTLRVEIDMPNKDSALRPGMYVYARVTTQLPAEWVLPASAVVKQGDQLVCFRLEGEKAVRTPVQVGYSDGEWVQVRSWLKTAAPVTWAKFDDKLVVARKAKGLTDGQTVTVVGK